MTDDRDTRIRALVVELLDASPPAPPLPAQPAPQAGWRHRRLGVVIACTAIVIGGTVAAVIVVREGDRPSASDVGIHAGHTTRPPLRYDNPTQPPPLRVQAGSNYVDVTTVLGCWYTQLTGGNAVDGVGRCADGVVDASRFRLVVSGRRRVVLRLPIVANVNASLAPGPAPTTIDHELPPLVTGSPVSLRQPSSNTWELSIPAAPVSHVLLIDIHADTTVSGTKVSGDAYYGLELTLAPRS